MTKGPILLVRVGHNRGRSQHSGELVPYSTATNRAAVFTYAAAVSATVLVVSAALLSPQLLLIGPAGIVAWFLVKSPAVRVIFFTIGALFVFQTGDALSPAKLAYFAGATFSLGAAIIHLHRTADWELVQHFRPALIGAGVLAAWMLGPSLLYSLAVQGISLQAWARDGLTALLICYAVVIGVDASAHFSRRYARLLLMSIGLLSAFGFGAAWLNKRGFGDPTDPSSGQFLLASIAAPAIPLAFALVMAFSGRGIKLLWLTAGSFIFLSVIVTGTRAGFVLALAVLGIIGAQRKARVPVMKASIGAVVAGSLIALAIPIVGAAFTSTTFLQQRISSIFGVLERGLLVDQSGVIRQRATGYALQIWEDNPLMGQGVGATFTNPNPNAVTSFYTLDTFLTYPAKHGLLGTVVLVVCLILIFKPLVGRVEDQWVAEATAVRGAVIVWLALLPFGPTTEDKGFAISVAVAFVAVGAAYRSVRIKESDPPLRR